MAFAPVARRRVAWWAIAVLVLGFIPLGAEAAGTGAAQTTMADSFSTPVVLFLKTAGDAAKSVANLLTSEQAMLIFAACVALRILAIVIPMMADKNGGDLGPESVKLAVTVAVVLALMKGWTSGLGVNGVYGWIWSGLDSLLKTVTSAVGALSTGVGGTVAVPAIPSTGDPLPGMAKWLFTSATNSIFHVYDDVKALGGMNSGTSFLGMLGGLGAYLVSMLLALVSVLVVAIVYLMMFLEMFLSWAHILIALAFGPLVLAFYPIKPDWGKNIVKEVASGIMSFMAVTFLVAVADAFIAISTTVLDKAAAAPAANPSAVGAEAMTTIAVYILVVLMIGYGVGAVSKVAAGLVGGTDHFSSHRGMGAAMAAAMGGAIGGAVGKHFAEQKRDKKDEERYQRRKKEEGSKTSKP